MIVNVSAQDLYCKSLHLRNNLEDMDFRFDIGQVVATKKIDIYPDETMPELRDRMSRLGADVLLDTIEKLPDILDYAKPQSNDGITYGKCLVSQIK